MSAFAIPAGVLERARAECAAIGAPDAVELITGRAALLGLGAPTRVSCGGASRILQGIDGWCALTLSRGEDLDAVGALLESYVTGDPWQAVTASVARRSVVEFVERARLLDIPAAVLGEVPATAPIITGRQPGVRRPMDQLLVADLSSMWAGPLCGKLLADAGATVVKVESPDRPDGTRAGDPAFFDWVNSGKLNFGSQSGSAFGSGELVTLLEAADVVIEASRPAALARHGLGPQHIPGRPGRVWLRISGYGPDFPHRIAFGDDAAGAGGLVVDSTDGPVFCGDAIADPLTGITATAAVLEALRAGGGAVIDVSMSAVAAGYAAAGGELVTVETLAPTPPAHRARALGADNDRVRTLVETRLAAC